MPTASQTAAVRKAALENVTPEQLTELADQLYAQLLPKLLDKALEVLPEEIGTGLLESTLELAVEKVVGQISSEMLTLESVQVERMLSCTASTSIGHVIPALFRARQKFAALTRNKENPHFGSSYADLGQVIAVTEQGLADEGLVLLQTPVYLSWKGQLEMFLQTRLYHVESLEWIQAWWFVDPAKRDAQGYGSAMTYGRRYPAMSVLGLAPEDDDGNAAADRGNTRRSREQPANEAPPPPTELTGEELQTVTDTIEGLTTTDALNALWMDLGPQGRNVRTPGLETALRAKAEKLRQLAAQAAAGEQPQGEAPDGGA